MRKKKTIVNESGIVKNGVSLRCGQGDATPARQGAACAAVEKTSTYVWFSCLVGVILLSLITRLHNLHQPASVWLVLILSCALI